MPFVPSDIAGQQFWLKADAIAGNDGDALGTWTDQTTNYTVAQGTAGAKPTLKKGANGINSQNVVRFDGGDAFYFDSADIFLSVGAATIVIVFKAANTTQDNVSPLLFSTISPGTTRAGFYFGVSGDGKLNVGGRRLDADTAQFIAGGNKSTSPTLALAYFDWTNSNLTLYENGTQTAQSLTFQTDGVTEAQASQICVGAATSDGAGNVVNGFTGDIAEVIVYNSLISTTNRNLLGGYIQDKYAITVAGATWTGPLLGDNFQVFSQWAV